MPFVVEPQPGEEVFVVKEFRSAHGHVFAMAVSNQAIYLPAMKFAAKMDPWYFKRVALSEVMEVSLVKQKPISIYLLSIAMIVFGVFMTYLMIGPVLRGEEGWVSGWPIAIIIGGFIVPFIGKGRKTLFVRMTKGKYKWRPQLAVDKESRDIYAGLQNEIIQACKKAGIRTTDSV